MRALNLDPNFARAYVSLAETYSGLRDFQSADKYYQEALKRVDQMSEREKHMVRGIYYLFKQNYKLAIEEYRALAKKIPPGRMQNGGLDWYKNSSCIR